MDKVNWPNFPERNELKILKTLVSIDLTDSKNLTTSHQIIDIPEYSWTLTLITVLFTKGKHLSKSVKKE